jgi:hypothetical protein
VFVILFVLLALVGAPPAAAACRPLGADFSPSQGDPSKLRVHFTVSGFGANRTVFLHYIGPNRHLRRTVRLGIARGRCGFLRTGYRKLFPFTTRPGTWRLRFSIRRTYQARATAPYVTIAVPLLRG